MLPLIVLPLKTPAKNIAKIVKPPPKALTKTRKTSNKSFRSKNQRRKNLGHSIQKKFSLNSAILLNSGLFFLGKDREFSSEFAPWKCFIKNLLFAMAQVCSSLKEKKEMKLLEGCFGPLKGYIVSWGKCWLVLT